LPPPVVGSSVLVRVPAVWLGCQEAGIQTDTTIESREVEGERERGREGGKKKVVGRET